MMKNWKRVPKLLVLSLFGFLLITACESQNSGTASNGGFNQSETVSLMKATAEDISTYRVECSNRKEKKVCIAVCHKPPGNPANFKSMILPLQAVMAHIEHGGPHHGDHDILGLCEGDDEEDMEEADEPEMDDDESDDYGADADDDSAAKTEGRKRCSNDSADDEATDDSGMDDPMGDDMGTGSTDPVSDEMTDLPAYCLDNLDLDADCDGVSDIDGDLLY